MYKILLPLFIILLCLNTLGAQEKTGLDIPLIKPREMALGIYASTNGIGGNLIYSLGNKIAIKAGYESLKFNYNFTIEEKDINYDSKLHYKTGGISLLLDYNLFQFLYLSGGIGFSLFNPKVTGVAASEMKYGDIYIPKEKIGDFAINIEPAMKISPYFGIGLGHNLGVKKRVAFNFELGGYYLGSPEVSIQATGLLTPTADPAHGQKEFYENQLSGYRIYPVIKFGLSYKLF